MNEQNQSTGVENQTTNSAEQPQRDGASKSNADGQENALTDLEPQGEIVGGQTREHILLARQVG